MQLLYTYSDASVGRYLSERNSLVISIKLFFLIRHHFADKNSTTFAFGTIGSTILTVCHQVTGEDGLVLDKSGEPFLQHLITCGKSLE